MRRFLILFLVLILVTITQAQTDTSTDDWEIVERCIGEPTAPPDDWSFDGVIFMFSGRAVHGINSNIPTPYIIAYNDSQRSFAWNGAVSPDGNWFAVPEGLRSSGGMIVYHYEVDRIRVYSTDGRREQNSIEVDSGISIGSDFPYTYIDIPVWLSNEVLIYPTLENKLERLNPFSNTRSIYNGDYSPLFIRDINRIRDENDERWIIAQVLFGNDSLFAQVFDNPYSSAFVVRANSTSYVADVNTQTVTNLCISVTGVAFSETDQIVVSTGEEILLIQDDAVYRLAYHDGTVFDWRFPDNH